MVSVMETDTPEPGILVYPTDAVAERPTALDDGPIAAPRTAETLMTALLVIDDAGRLREVAGFLLASGLQVESVSDPYLAGGLAVPGHRYAVILLDVLLPVRELYRLCRRLRSSGRVPMVIAS